MYRSEPEEKISRRSGHPNPFCPVCAGTQNERGLPGDAKAGPRESAEHMCLLSILNAFYALSRKIEMREK